MAGEYDLNLSNGTILATLHPLEVNGPDNSSTPRLIQAVDVSGNTFTLNGDLTYRFVAGFQFTVQDSAGNDGTYTVAAGGSSLVGSTTVIPVVENISTAGLPLGSIKYTIFDPNTTLSLPGRGTVNYGEYFIDNLVHMLENFAADFPPDNNPNIGSSPAGQSLVGQWWYNTTAGQEGFKYFDGSSWTSDFDVDNGVLKFRDPQNTNVPNTDVMITADETSLAPYGWANAAEAGMVIWTKDNPVVGDPILRVMSAGGSERLRVEHDAFLSTSNNLEVLATSTGTNASFIDGTLAIGGHTSGSVNRAVPDSTLTVQGNGIAVNSDLANDAMLTLNSPAGMLSGIDFKNNGTSQGDITVDSGPPTAALQLNTYSSNDVVLVNGGGDVGIGTQTPSAKLDVVGQSEFNGDVRVVSSDAIFDNGYGLESAAGALLKTGSGGETWQVTPGSATANAFIINDSSNNSIITVSETAGTSIDQYDFFVNTNTLYVDSTNSRVGINTTPSYPLDVSGNARFAGRVGINTTPPTSGTPTGTNIWLSVLGDIYSGHQFLSVDGTASRPAYSFANHTNYGMFWRSNGLEFSIGSGIGTLRLSSTELTSLVPISSPEYDFFGDPGTAISNPGPSTLEISAGVNSGKLTIEADGTLSVPSYLNYETLVTSDDDIPNKKYVDDAIKKDISWREPVVVRDQVTRTDSSAFPTTGTIDGIPLSVGDRVLFNDVNTVADRDVWIWTGTGWTQDTSNTRSVGDVVYVQNGTDFGKAYAFNKDNEWTLISGAGGGSVFVVREVYVAAPGQTVFSLANKYKPTASGSGLMVYVQGVKYTKDSGYTETDNTTVTMATPLIGGEVVEFYILSAATSTASLKRELQTGLTGNPTVTLTSMSYVVGADQLMVYLNGQKAIVGSDYTEITPTTFNWIGASLSPTDKLEMFSGVPVMAGTLLSDVDDVSSTPPNNGDVLSYNNVSGLWEPGNALSGQYYFTNPADVSPGTDGAITIGDVSGYNITADNNEIMARNNGAAAALHLQNDGGALRVNAAITANGTSPITVGSEAFKVWHAGNDGSGSGLDADTLDTLDSTQFLRSDAADTKTSGTLTFNDNVSAGFGTSNDALHTFDGSHYYIDIGVTPGANMYIRDANASNATRFTFDVPNGNFTATGDVTAFSDKRVKTNIQRIENPIDKVKNLNGYTFDRTDIDTKRQTGVIAQEVIEVLPEAVMGGPTEENPDEKYSVAYGNMVGLLIEAIKEQQNRIDEQQEQIDYLKSKIKELEK